MKDRVIASAPGSLMLFGEHAVIHGHLSLVCAIKKRIRVILTPRVDTTINITSALGTYSTSLSRVEIAPELRFVLTVVKRKAEKLKTGFDLAIESEFSHEIGFGSSAAVTVATTAALAQLTCGTVDQEFLFASCRDTIRAVQGLGSGADVAASVHGGIVLYRADPLEIEALPHQHPITAVYSGSKRPTPEVVEFVESQRRASPTIYSEIFDAMDQCAMDAGDAVAMQDWKTFGRMMNIAQGLMDAIGVNTLKLSEIVYALRKDPGILGSKISGSGLGDCAIGLGHVAGKDFPFEAMRLEMDPQGVIVEKS